MKPIRDLEADLVVLEQMRADLLREIAARKRRRKAKTPSERMAETWRKAKAYDEIKAKHPELFAS